MFTNVIRRSDDFTNLFMFLNDPGHLKITKLDFTIWEFTHQHYILGLKLNYERQPEPVENDGIKFCCQEMILIITF